MTGRDDGQAGGGVDELIRAIENKLRSQQATVAKSLGYGRIVWRTKNQGFEIDLEPRL